VLEYFYLVFLIFGGTPKQIEGSLVEKHRVRLSTVVSPKDFSGLSGRLKITQKQEFKKKS
jgi:hypothetical protein